MRRVDMMSKAQPRLARSKDKLLQRAHTTSLPRRPYSGSSWWPIPVWMTDWDFSLVLSDAGSLFCHFTLCCRNTSQSSRSPPSLIVDKAMRRTTTVTRAQSILLLLTDVPLERPGASTSTRKPHQATGSPRQPGPAVSRRMLRSSRAARPSSPLLSCALFDFSRWST